MKSVYGTLGLCYLLIACFAPVQVFSDLVFVDWTNINTSAETATGDLSGITVNFSAGFDVFGGTTNNTSTLFSSSDFNPALPVSDEVGIQLSTAVNTITFSQAIFNPIFHFNDLGSTLTFLGGPTVTKLSGDGGFNVSGSQIIGSFLGGSDNDSDGTVQLSGAFTSISFSGNLTSPADGINFQVGAATVPEPSTYALCLLGLALLGFRKK